MADVFISYAKEDRDKARKLASILESRGWSVWWDRKIIAGQTFDQIIERELELSKSVIVLWSTYSINSEWVKNEAAVASEKGVLVPALIDRVKLPLEFRRKQTVDLVGWDGNSSHSGLQPLYEGISTAIVGTATSLPIVKSVHRLRWIRQWTLAIIIGVLAVALGFLLYRIKIQPKPEYTSQHTTKNYQGQNQSGYRDDLLRQLSKDQVTALEMFVQGKPEAIALIDKNLTQIDKVLSSFPNDADFHSLMGYTLKDLYQTSKNLLPTEKRLEYLSRAQKSFAQALQLDTNNAAAHNGMGNILFFKGKFDEAIKEHEIALQLTGGNYPFAEQDKQLVTKVRNGEIPFDF